jgi:hypothetical protein
MPRTIRIAGPSPVISSTRTMGSSSEPLPQPRSSRTPPNSSLKVRPARVTGSASALLAPTTAKLTTSAPRQGIMVPPRP